MKTKFLFLLWLPVFCFSQGNENECANTETQLDALVKSDKYDMAYQLWESSTKCVSESINGNGEKILLHLLAAPTTEAQKQKFVTELLKVYENDEKQFPENSRSNLVKRAMVVDQYQPENKAEIYNLLDRAFTSDKKHFTDVKALYMYFDLYFAKFKAGEKSVSEESVFAKSDDVSGRLSQLIETTKGNRDYKTALNGIRALVSPLASCEKLNAYYTKVFEIKKNDTLWLKPATENLAFRECFSGPVFMSMAAQWYKVNPVSASAFHLGLAHLYQRNKPKAIEYFDIAADLEQDNHLKADIYYKAAVIIGDKNAIKYAKKAIAADPKYSRAYLFLAQLYSRMDCGQTPFEKRAILFLAAQTARKASNNAEFVNKAAQAQVQKYLQRAPTKAEIKEANQAGKTIHYGCGIDESVVIPE